VTVKAAVRPNCLSVVGGTAYIGRSLVDGQMGAKADEGAFVFDNRMAGYVVAVGREVTHLLPQR
jgi:hypothetical protein